MLPGWGYLSAIISISLKAPQENCGSGSAPVAAADSHVAAELVIFTALVQMSPLISGHSRQCGVGRGLLCCCRARGAEQGAGWL